MKNLRQNLQINHYCGDDIENGFVVVNFFWREKNIYSDFWHGSKRLRTPANAIKATKDEIRVALLPILVSWPAKNMYVVDKLQSTDYEKLLQCVSSSF